MEENSSQPTCYHGLQLNKMRLNGEFVDMEIIVGSETFHVHRVIMAAISEYFKAVMSNKMREATENRVIIDGVDPDTMKTVIEFCYTNQVSLNDDNFNQVLSAAFRFCVQPLQDKCIKFIQSMICASNCTRLIHLFQQYDLEHLHDKAIGICLENFDLVCETPKFFDIDEDLWKILLPAESLNLSESGIFRALVKWTEHDLENRKAAFERLVKQVRFATIDASELSELSSFKLATISESCKELIAKVKNYLEIKRQDKQSGSEALAEISATPRRNLRNCQRMYAIGGRGYVLSDSPGSSRYHRETLSSVEIYDPNTDTWTEAAPMHSRRTRFGCTVLDDHIYVAGGSNEDGPLISSVGYSVLNNFERYSIAQNAWEILPMMSHPRRDLALVALGKDLYAIGGYDGHQILSMVERFCPDERKWNSCAPMISERSLAAHAVLDGYIYVIGGEIWEIAKLEKYDPKTDSWCSLVSVPGLNKRLECTYHGADIYIMGWPGPSTSKLQFLVFNPSRMSGYKLPEVPIDKRHSKFLEFGRQLFAVSWKYLDDTKDVLVSYNRETRQWSPRAGMSTEGAERGYIVHPQRSYPDHNELIYLMKFLLSKNEV